MHDLRSSLRPLHVAFYGLALAACGGSTVGTADIDAGGAGSSSSAASAGSKASGSSTPSASATPVGSSSGETSSPSQAESSTTADTSTAASTAQSTSTSGASTSTSSGTGANTCNSLAAPTVKASLACGMGPQPAFTGGTITPGNYNVTKVDLYIPDGGTNICGFLGLETVMGDATVTAAQLQLLVNVSGVESKSIAIDGSYTESTDTLTVTPTCGASSSSVETVEYTATATTLVIDATIMGYTGLVTLDLTP